MTTYVLNQRYELEQPIGQGGMATVYRARDLRLGRLVALKVLHPRYVDDQEFVQRFDHEAKSAASLSAHPNIVDVYDVGEDGNMHYIVMELVEGEDLKWVIEREAPLPVGRALQMVEQIADGLDYAHQRGFVHRDVKPQNVLLDRDGQARITDFGIAKSHLSTALTQAGMTFGTADYISPEQAQGLEAQPQSDVYSLGVVLYELLTRQLPFTGETPMAVAIQHIQQAPPPPRQLNPTIPQPLEALILRAMHKDPRERPASARQLAMALRDIRMGRAQSTVSFADAPTVVNTSPAPTSPAQRSQRPQRRDVSAPTVANTSPARRPVAPPPYTPPPAPAASYDQNAHANYADPVPQQPTPRPAPRRVAPPAVYDDYPVSHAEQPRQGGGMIGNLVTLLFLVLGAVALYLLVTTDVWIAPLRGLVGF